MTRINTNTGSLVAQNRLNRTNADLQTSLTRLSTGLRINNGKDDPAGLIASESLRSDITSLNKAISNTKRATQIIATADSALGQVSSLLNNIRGLVVEAANKGALSDGEVDANQLQVDSSLEAINRIARTTTFQGRNLLDGSLDFLTQAGTNFSNIRDLKIDQANLGPTGQLGVAVTIDSAATQAEVAVSNISTPIAGVAATGSLTLTNTVAGVGAQRSLEFTQTIAGSTSTTGPINTGLPGSFTLTTKNDTDAFNGATVNVSTVATGSFSSITIDDISGDINVVLEEGKTLAQIALDLASHADFDFTSVGAVAVTNAATGSGTFDSLGSEGTSQTASIDITAIVGGPSTFSITVDTASGAPPASPTASFNSGTGVLTVNVANSGATSLEAIQEAIDGLADFSATLDDPDSIGYFDVPGGDTTAQGSLTAPVAASSQTATINLTSNATGAQVNGDTITFATGAVTSPQISVATNGNLTVTVSNSGSTTIASIISAINAEGTYLAEAASGNTLTSYSSGVTNTTTPFSGGVTGGGGISHDVVFELLGQSGSQVFNVKAGTSINELIAQINLVSDATGVSAQEDSLVPNKLILRSTAYGSDAFVDLRVINEAASGTFRTAVGAGARDFGRDIIAKVNGVDANGKGNSLSINTASLALSLTVDLGSDADINFTINGGGALFQLGGQVVSNQQARVGISSVSTARLGGPSGRLYQLGKGESGSLDTDPNVASKIIDEAITQVTSLRGRLGAFQATTLESNLASLNETVANLTEAESSIRDADFAQESARLTRAQILIQSGTTVLGIANQSPQNVLGLLRQ